MQNNVLAEQVQVLVQIQVQVQAHTVGLGPMRKAELKKEKQKKSRSPSYKTWALHFNKSSSLCCLSELQLHNSGGKTRRPAANLQKRSAHFATKQKSGKENCPFFFTFSVENCPFLTKRKLQYWKCV